MKLKIIFLCFVLPLNWLIAPAQSVISKKPDIELNVGFGIQRPFYSVTTPYDILLPKQNRYRILTGFGIRYYGFRRWYSGIYVAYGQAGSGFARQFTNANYLKNSIFFGYISDPERRIILELFSGVEVNILLSAKLKNTVNDTRENVFKYFNKIFLSYPFGVGIITHLNDDCFISAQSFLSFGTYKTTRNNYLKTSQIIFPAFQVKISKFIQY